MLTNIFSLAFLAGAVAASPCKPTHTTTTTTASYPTSTAVTPGDPFGIMALRSASPIHFAPASAALNSLFLNLPSQNATCADGSSGPYATFVLKPDGSLYLYNNKQQQQLFVDRSGMGQGKLGYTTGSQPGPRNGERVKFAVDANGDLSFNGRGFLACPDSIDGAWSVWVDVGNANPGGNSGCLGFAARAVKSTKPVSCEYTQQ